MPPSDPYRGGLDGMAPAALSRQEFARRLHKLMLEKNMTPSDLARKAFGSRKDPATGYQVAKSRDAVSTYLRGRNLPGPLNLKRIADALGVKPEDLLPNTIMAAIDAEQPALEFKQAVGHPNEVWLRLNQRLPFDIASQIVQLVNSTVAPKK